MNLILYFGLSLSVRIFIWSEVKPVFFSSFSALAAPVQSCGKSTPHQLCPTASPIIMRSEVYSPAGSVMFSNVLSGYTSRETVTETGYSHPFESR